MSQYPSIVVFLNFDLKLDDYKLRGIITILMEGFDEFFKRQVFDSCFITSDC
jgi:hypothetical protein